MLFRGNAPALVTPFSDTNTVDEPALRTLIDDQIQGGVAGLVVLGTTGENPTISHEERRRIVALVIEHTAGRVPVIVGTGTNDTRQSIAYSREAAAEGANGLLVVAPYYNKPLQSGMYEHVAAIADATECPIIVYNVPGRTAFNVLPETLLRMAEQIPSVVGVKEASGDLSQIADILKHRTEDFAVYSGDDEMTLPILFLGGDGVISVLSNACPDRMSELVRAGLDGDYARSRALHFELLEAMRGCFYESNPVPIKTILALKKKMKAYVRLPLTAMNPANVEALMNAFKGVV